VFALVPCSIVLRAAPRDGPRGAAPWMPDELIANSDSDSAHSCRHTRAIRVSRDILDFTCAEFFTRSAARRVCSAKLRDALLFTFTIYDGISRFRSAKRTLTASRHKLANSRYAKHLSPSRQVIPISPIFGDNCSMNSRHVVSPPGRRMFPNSFICVFRIPADEKKRKSGG